MTTKFTEEQKLTVWKRIEAKLKAGLTIDAINKTEIAKLYGISPRSVGRIIEKYNKPVVESTQSEDEGNIVLTAEKLQESTKSSDVEVINWTITQNSVLLTLSDGENASITKDNANYKKVCEMLMSGDLNVMELVNPAKGFEYKYGNIEVDEDGVLFEGRKVPKEIAFFVIDAVRAGNKADAERYAKFLNNLMDNPSYRAVNTLYPFLKHNDIQINDDGMILAWKRITADFKDVYTKTIDNSIGTVVKVRRNEVEEDPNKTCARGLHLCAKHYLSSYSGDVIVQCLLNPRDVCAVPLDYNGSKLRCNEYKVIREVTEDYNAGKL
jgi:hypothetical protein